jgi:hypothetical protein
MRIRLKIVLLAFTSLFISGVVIAQQLQKSAAPGDAAVYISSPASGAVVSPTFTVVFGLSGMGVAPSGVERANTGHHHLLIDGSAMPDLNTPLGTSVTHFGGGQTQTTLTLDPGTHTLQLILGDHLHLPHQPAVVSEVITVTVR